MAIETKTIILHATEAAYFAGFVDADGSIGIVSVGSTKQYVVQMAVVNRDKQIIEEFARKFGGKIRTRNQDHSRWQVCYEWKVTARKACAAIVAIYPYLRQKTAQAMLALEVQEIKDAHTSGEKRWNPSIKIEQDKQCKALKGRCAELNKRGK